MMSSATITRRRLLRALTSLGTFALLSPGCALAKVGRSNTHDPLALKLAQVFTYSPSAAIIGLEYLRCVPQEADVGLLVDLICASQPKRRAEFAQAHMGKLRALLRSQQRHDFERGRTAEVQGWILSQTEVRLCGLAALIS
jgi:hypothetical protein